MAGEQADLLPRNGEALVVVDVQNDFLPGGALGVPRGDRVVPVLNRYLSLFGKRGVPIFATRDSHPADHCSFRAEGGPWPPQCISGTSGAQFPADPSLPAEAEVISKATGRVPDCYSGFDGTGLAQRLRAAGGTRIFVGGLATDCCIVHTVQDALAEGFAAVLLVDAIAAVDVRPGDGESAIREMARLGAPQEVACRRGMGALKGVKDRGLRPIPDD